MRKRSQKRKAKRKVSPLTVMDLFCGAGGFSEGFRSAGYKIVHGVEKWKAAVDTFNCNFGLNIPQTDMLYYEGCADRIEELPDTDIIIGSPPCVSFSFSNKLGTADKTLGIRLMKVYFAIVAVKKHKPSSKLKAWFMENVPNALNSLPESYTFKELGLSKWCAEHSIKPDSIAVEIAANAAIVDAADYGAPQVRKRLFVHEYMRVKGGKTSFIPPKNKHMVTLGQALSELPAPNCKKSSRKIKDPLYSGIGIPLNQLTDHFYENGVYEDHWRECQYLKTNHPFMGRMSFPDCKDKPSRTVLANSAFRSREAHIYKSEWNRRGHGKYRMPTVREAATLMSFPITYQFVGLETAKWRLVGNAVCPFLARALAQQLLRRLGRKVRNTPRTKIPKLPKGFLNLNVFKGKVYDNPPKRKSKSRFRRHPFKSAGLTVALSNYNIDKNGASDGRWRCYVTHGAGKGYQVKHVPLGNVGKIRAVVEKISGGKEFVKQVTNGFSKKIPPAPLMQKLYEDGSTINGYVGPLHLIEEADRMINRHAKKNTFIDMDHNWMIRDTVPVNQLFALFAISQIAHVAATKKEKRHG